MKFSGLSCEFKNKLHGCGTLSEILIPKVYLKNVGVKLLTFLCHMFMHFFFQYFFLEKNLCSSHEGIYAKKPIVRLKVAGQNAYLCTAQSGFSADSSIIRVDFSEM